MSTRRATLTAADHVWIATASLQKENGLDADFGIEQILDRALSLRGKNVEEKTLRAHIAGHAVASNPPSPAAYRILHKTGRGRRRLFRQGDPVHPLRNGKTHPNPDELPEEYRPLVAWYEQQFTAPHSLRGNKLPPGAPAEKLFQFMGTITKEDAEQMKRFIEQCCERVDAPGW